MVARVKPRKFPPARLREIDATKYCYIRSGDEHRFIAVWVVVVNGRVLARSWSDQPAGWFRAFLANPAGAIRLGTKAVPVRARRVRGAPLIEAMDRAYAAKYTTASNRPYVTGFRAKTRRANTIEFLPA